MLMEYKTGFHFPKLPEIVMYVKTVLIIFSLTGGGLCFN